jgi:hypothetical protein
MLDPNFPKRLLKSGPGRTLNCISYLIQEYSKRSLTVPTDRRVAISALEDRIKGAMKDHIKGALKDRIKGALKDRIKGALKNRIKGTLKDRIEGALEDQSIRYGIFQEFLHRNLLWRADDSQLQEIQYDSPLPSWTWMAYSGGVKFIDVEFGEMEWINSIRFDKKNRDAIMASLWAFREWTPVHCGTYHEVQDPNGATKGRIYFDLGGGDILGKEYCVVVGMKVPRVASGDNDSTSTEYHILVVRSTDVDREYRRVGAGTVHCSHVVRQRAAVRVV